MALLDQHGRPASALINLEQDVLADTTPQWRDRVDDYVDRNVSLIEAQFTKGMLDHVREMDGWELYASLNEGGIISDIDRRKTIAEARLRSRYDALCVQTIGLYTDFALGNGFSVKTENEATAKLIKEFWSGRHNSIAFGFQGQRQSSDQLLIDGELFFVLFGKEAATKVRKIDPLEIQRIVTNPEDATEPWWYLREYSVTNKPGEIEKKKIAYRDIYAPDTPEAKEVPADYDEAEDDPVVYHVALNTLGGRGNSLLTAGMPWSKAYRQFLQSRCAIQQAIARLAWSRKIKGGPAAVQAARIQEQSGYVTGDTETNPPPAFGATRVHNEADEMTPYRFDTGAAGAQQDASLILATFGSAVGIFPHYFGSGFTFRMATSESMELPMLKRFSAYQMLWIAIDFDLIDYAITPDEKINAREVVDIMAPPIVEENVPEIVKSIVEIIKVVPGLAENEEVLKNLLVVTGHGEKADQIVKDVLEKVAEAAEKKPVIPPVAEAPLEEQVAAVTWGMRGLRQRLELVENDGNGKGNDGR